MLGLIKVVIAVLLGVLVGLLLTIHTLDRNGRTVVAGPWQRAPHDGTPDIDPYTLAADERSSVLPLGVAEGLTFVARSDSKGRRFASNCTYVLRGPMPPARYWTVSLLNPDGFPVADPAGRFGFTSAEVLREIGDELAITISPEARSGNWLPTGHAKAYVLMLRLYDTGLSSVGVTLDAATMPTIKRLGCA